MRTTIYLPDDLHRVVMAIARDQGTSFSDAVAQLLRKVIGAPGSARVSISERTGLDVIHLGQTITSDDVRALDD